MTLVFELSSIDRHFADFILKESGGASSALKIAVSLLSNSVGNGNICLNLADIAGKEIRIDGEEFSVPEFKNLHNALLSTPVVGSPGDFRPLVLDKDGRLYLYRYWKYERDLAQVILQKAALSCDVIDKALFAQGLDRLSLVLQKKMLIGKRWRPWHHCGKRSASYPADRGRARPPPLSRSLRSFWSKPTVNPCGSPWQPLPASRRRDSRRRSAR